MKRSQIVNRIAEVMRSVAPDAQTILYGSEARGDAKPNSDIDLLILLKEPHVAPEREMEITTRLYEVEVDTGVVISPMILSKRQWENRPFQTPFSINVMNEGVAL
ncbi:MAG: nucleotidyltransferase domain-containing protein [Bacteroides sp.]|nr:nucleotidyltransferase domain-containing protein [Bacteroides sp.]